MLVKKGGIRREIDPKRLEEYREKGYSPVPPPDPPKPETPTTLEKKAPA